MISFIAQTVAENCTKQRRCLWKAAAAEAVKWEPGAQQEKFLSLGSRSLESIRASLPHTRQKLMSLTCGD